MRRRVAIAVGVIALSGMARGAFAGTLTAGKHTVDGGGVSFVSAGAFTLGGTIGQPDAGRLVWMPYALLGGFWPGSVGAIVSVGGPGSEAPLPTTLRVLPARPNPTASATRLDLELPRATLARAAVYDVRGAVVRDLLHRELPAGRQPLDWDGRDSQGRRVDAGLYLVRIQLGSLHTTQKVAVIR